MIVQRANGPGGTYWYFFCRGRQDHTCTAPYRDMDHVEAAVLHHYATVQLDPAFRDQVRDLLHETLADEEHVTRLLHDQLKAQLAKQDVPEENLLDLAADSDMPHAKIRRRLHRIKEQRQTLTHQLADTDSQLDPGAGLLEAALDLLDNIQEAYRQTTDHGRRLLDQAIFDKLYVGDNGLTADELRQPFDILVTAQQAKAHPSLPHRRVSRAPAPNANRPPANWRPENPTGGPRLTS